MTSRESRKLVVDTCIARSAGETEHPTSKLARDVLTAVLKYCHKAVFTRKLWEEWKEHRSRFSKTWLASMYARKKVVRIPESERPEIRSKLAGIGLTGKEVQAIEKDFHLVAAALDCDKILISCDNSLHVLITKYALDIGDLRELMFVDPSSRGIDWIEWIYNGAEHEKVRD